MAHPVRAIYSEGQLRLLEPVELSEGQEIQVMILSDDERVRAALGDLLVEFPEDTEESIDEEALLREIAEGFRNRPSVAEIIIQERW